MNTLELHVIGLPKGQPRARACIRGGHAATYNPSNADDWKACIAAAVKESLNGRTDLTMPIFTGPTRVDCTFFFPRPKAHFRKNGSIRLDAPVYHIAKPDRDNLDKAVLDLLTQKQILADDKQVCAGLIQKLYAAQGQAAGARIHILSLNQTH